MSKTRIGNVTTSLCMRSAPKKSGTPKGKRDLPKHVAIVPDGNRRWAKRNGLPVIEGHRKGIAKIRNVLRWCREYGVDTLSMWGFSCDNLLRPKREVNGLFKLFDETLMSALRDAKKEDVRVRFFGRLSIFPARIRNRMMRLENESSTGRYALNLFLGYGGRQEIVDAVNALLKDCSRGKLRKVNEKIFSKYLYTTGISDPDLVIRTSGERRTSGFMPWQTVYSEYYFSKKLWPDFTKRDFVRALSSYSDRIRRFGR